MEGLTGDLSDGSKLEGFHREQYGGTIGGPIKKDKAFFFLAFEGINGNFERPNLSRQLGDVPCPVQNPTVPAERGAHQRQRRLPADGAARLLPVAAEHERRHADRRIRSARRPSSARWTSPPTPTTTCSALVELQSFAQRERDVRRRDLRPVGQRRRRRSGADQRHEPQLVHDDVVADGQRSPLHLLAREPAAHGCRVRSRTPTPGMGFGPSFRFGDPFFLQPNVDELIWRTQFKDNVSIVTGKHTFKVGGEWMHTLNDQVFRGFFTGRYIFGSVTGFLRYASPAAAGGFGPNTVGCSNGSYVTSPAACPAGSTTDGGPLLLYLQGAGRTGPATDAAGASRITNDEFSLFAQDSWQVRPNLTLNYGLRWDAQTMPETVDPTTTAYGGVPRRPDVPLRRHDSEPVEHVAAAAWRGVGRQGRRQVARAHQLGRLLRAAEHAEPGRIGHDQRPAAADDFRQHRRTCSAFGAPTPTWPDSSRRRRCPTGSSRSSAASASSIATTRIRTSSPSTSPTSSSWRTDWAGYVDFIWNEGNDLTRFLNYNRSGSGVLRRWSRHGQQLRLQRASPGGCSSTRSWSPTAAAQSLYRGLTLGVRKRLSNGFQLEGNYVLAKDEDDDSNERDPFTDCSFNFFDLSKDWGPARIATSGTR